MASAESGDASSQYKESFEMCPGGHRILQYSEIELIF
jgi:hypothetical protein